MGAGTVAGTALPGAGEDAALRAVYSAAVGRADREVVNALAAAVADLERRREGVRREAAAAQRLAGRLRYLKDHGMSAQRRSPWSLTNLASAAAPDA